MGRVDWLESGSIWDKYDTTHEGDVDYRQAKDLRAVQLLPDLSKMESMVRYLGIEMGDALEITERIEIKFLRCFRSSVPVHQNAQGEGAAAPEC